MVGALIALVVVSIVFEGIPLFGWIETLVKLILFFHLIKEIIQYFSLSKEQKAYRYHTTGEDLWHIWLATLIVSIILNAIFPHDPWWARIAPSVLIIKAIETSILFFVTRHQNQKENQQEMMNKSDLYGRYESDTKYSPQTEPVVRVVNTPTSPKQSQQTFKTSMNYNYQPPEYSEQDTPSYCPMCGEKHSKQDQYCARCGANLRQ
jgi:glucan phosphoethanolaminetransferase (alkaline phosphatase superfamily)